MKGVWIDDAFVEDHSLSLGFLDRFQGFGVGVTFDFVGIVYGDDSRFVEGDGDFVDDVGLETVEGETGYLTLHVPVFGSVPVILGTDDVIPGFQFAGEFA